MFSTTIQVGELPKERLGRAYVFLNKVSSILLSSYLALTPVAVTQSHAIH